VSYHPDENCDCDHCCWYRGEDCRAEPEYPPKRCDHWTESPSVFWLAVWLFLYC
jgi:hypothetical protein